MQQHEEEEEEGGTDCRRRRRRRRREGVYEEGDDDAEDDNSVGFLVWLVVMRASSAPLLRLLLGCTDARTSRAGKGDSSRRHRLPLLQCFVFKIYIRNFFLFVAKMVIIYKKEAV
jgi:hypothetical protein